MLPQPDLERQSYIDHVSRGGRVAFMSTNPLHADPSLNNSGLTTSDRLYSFSSNAQHDNFSEAVMTALITSAERASAAESQIGEIVMAIADSVKFIKRRPIACAYEISEFLLSYARWGARSDDQYFLGAPSVGALARSLDFLNQDNAFNDDPELQVSDKHIQNTVDVRSVVAPLLGKDYHKRSPEEIGSVLRYCSR